MADVHPLYLALTGQTELCVVEVCELAALLLHFRNDRGIGDVISSLRDADKYQPTTMELDFAWKFAGAGAIVSLAPPTAHGVADCSVSVDGREFIIEVSGFPSDAFRSDLMAFNGAMTIALKAAERRSGIRGNIAIEVVVEPKPGQRADLRRLRKDAHAAVVAAVQIFADANRAVDYPCDFGRVAVRVAQPHEKPDVDEWTMASCLTEVPRSLLGLVGEIDYKSGRDTHWVYIRVPDDAFDPYERIGSKLKIESRQLRGCNDGVIVVAINGLKCGQLSAGDPALKNVIDAFQRNHKSTTAIALPVRPRKQDGTSGITGPFFALAESAMSQAFWERTLAADRERTVLWELDALG